MTYKQLTQEQRYQLHRLNEMGFLQKIMAEIFGVSTSTISRELKRNTGKRGLYLKSAHPLTLERRKGKAKSRFNETDWQLIERYIKREASPEQISLRLKLKKRLSISPEWIYHYILEDKHRGGSLYTH